MEMFRKLADKLGMEYSIDNIDEPMFKNDTNRTEEINAERQRQKQDMIKNLTRIGFTEKEINEVMEILNICEYRVQLVKDELIGTNINNDQAMEILDKKLQEIRDLQLKAAENIRKKVAEIIERKKSQNKG